MDLLVNIVHYAITGAAILLDGLAVILMLVAAVQTVIRMFRKEEELALFFSRRISNALNFMLCGVILQLLSARSIGDVIMVAAVILTHCAVSLYLHWEIRHHENKSASESEQETVIELEQDDDDDDDDDSQIMRIG